MTAVVVRLYSMDMLKPRLREKVADEFALVAWHPEEFDIMTEVEVEAAKRECQR